MRTLKACIQARVRHTYVTLSNRQKTEDSGFIAERFKAMAHAKRNHVSNYHRNIQGKGDAVTADMVDFSSRTMREDLQIGIEGETFEMKEMHHAYLEIARA